MNRINDNEKTLRKYLGEPLLLIVKSYLGINSEIMKSYFGINSDLSPESVYMGILEEGVRNSIWINGLSLNLKRDRTSLIIYNIMGQKYMPMKYYCQTPLPLPNSEVYVFDSTQEGIDTIKSIINLEEIKPIK